MRALETAFHRSTGLYERENRRSERSSSSTTTTRPDVDAGTRSRRAESTKGGRLLFVRSPLATGGDAEGN